MTTTARIKRLCQYARLGDVHAYDDGSAIVDDLRRGSYQNVLGALRSYAQGVRVEHIASQFNFSRQWLNDLVNRHEKLGREALVLYSQSGERVPSPETLTKPAPCANKVRACFLKYPEVEIEMRAAALDNVDPHDNSRKTPFEKEEFKALFHERLELAQQARIEKGELTPEQAAREFPMGSPDGGKSALWRWRCQEQAKRQAAHMKSEEIARAAREAVFPEDRRGPIYSYVETDGHYIDVNWKITFIGPDGTSRLWIPVKRLWLIPLLEGRTKAALGYSWAIGKGYGPEHVCQAIRNALVPWRKRKLTVKGIAYGDGESMPSGYHPLLAWICCDVLGLDNYSSHLAESHISTVERMVAARLRFGSVKEPNARPHAEGFFHLLEAAGIHPSPPSTGSHSYDEENSHLPFYEIELEVFLDLLDLLLCKWNASEGIQSNERRLDTLKRLVTAPGALFRRVPESMRDELESFDMWVGAHIARQGRRMATYACGGYYYGAGIADLPVNEDLLLAINSTDRKWAKAWRSSTGELLGMLKIEKRFSHLTTSVTAARYAKMVARHNRYSSKTGTVLLQMRRNSEKQVFPANPKWSAAAAQFIYEQVQIGTRLYFESEDAHEHPDQHNSDVSNELIDAKITVAAQDAEVSPLIDLNEFAGWNTD